MSEITNRGITINITDTNEIPYEYSNDYVIYKETDTVSNAVRLKSCDIKTGKTTEIYNFRPQYNSSSA